MRVCSCGTHTGRHLLTRKFWVILWFPAADNRHLLRQCKHSVSLSDCSTSNFLFTQRVERQMHIFFSFLASGLVLMASYKSNCKDCPKPRSMLASQEEPVPSEGWEMWEFTFSRRIGSNADSLKVLAGGRACLKPISLQSNIGSF